MGSNIGVAVHRSQGERHRKRRQRVTGLDAGHAGRLRQRRVDRDQHQDQQSEEFRKAFEVKFQLDLSKRPTTITVRGRCDTHDGKIHHDSASKIITVLLYMNPAWDNSGGRLRVLRSRDSIEDVTTEAPAAGGALVAFLRSDHSWHGHLPFIGERRVIQFNWVTDNDSQRFAIFRHRVSASVKQMLSFGKSSKERRPFAPGRM